MAGFDRESRELILESLRGYARQKLKFEHLLDLDKGREMAKEQVREMNDPETLGIHLLMIPAEFGGMGGGMFDAYRVCEAPPTRIPRGW